MTIRNTFGHVELIRPEAFQQGFEELMRIHLDNQNEENEGARTKKRKRDSRQSMLSRWAKLRVPFDKRLRLSAVKLPDGILAETAQDKVDASATHWKPVFRPEGS